jgi:hypothetical protein
MIAKAVNIMKRILYVVLLASIVIISSSLYLVSCGGGGGGGGGTPTMQVYLRFCYTANELDSSISIYWLDAITGRLKLAADVAAGTRPASIATVGSYE